MFEDFNKFFDFFINICLEFNKLYNINHQSFIHIKGGASIQYQINLKNCTNDIDLFIIGNFDNFHDFLTENYELYTKNMTIENDNGLIKLKFYNEYNVDVTEYNSKYNFKYSIFLHGLKKLGYEDGHDYFKVISNKKNIMELTFTSLDLENHCVTYSIDFYYKFITRGIPFRKKFIKENPESLLTKKYLKEISDEYRSLIIDKLCRYETKLEQLNKTFENNKPNKKIKLNEHNVNE